jgi:hypothetical protein
LKVQAQSPESNVIAGSSPLRLGSAIAITVAIAVSATSLSLSVVHAEASARESVVWALAPLLIAIVSVGVLARRSPHRAPLIALVVVAFCLRAALGLFMYTEVLKGRGFGSIFVNDDRYFFDLGVQLADHWQTGAPLPLLGIASQPGHVYLHGAVVYALGADPRNFVPLSSLIGALTAAALIAVSTPFLPRQWMMVPGWLFAVLPHQLYLAASNQRDVVITFLCVLLVAVLVRMQEGTMARFRSLTSVAVVALLSLIAVWRLPAAAVMAAFALTWSLLRGRDQRGRLVLPLLVVAALAALLAVLPTDFLAEGPGGIFAGIDRAYGRVFDSTQTFGFLVGGRGMARFLFLPLTLPLSIVFGFVPRSGAPNSDLNSLGFLYVWTPLIVPIAVGAFRWWRTSARRTFVVWGAALALLLPGATAYYGLVPRFRSAAEPFLIIVAVVGLLAMRGLLAAYVPLVLAGVVAINVLVWTPASALVPAVAVTLVAIAIPRLLRPLGRVLVSATTLRRWTSTPRRSRI